MKTAGINYICLMTASKTYFGFYFYYFFGKKPGILLLNIA
jgi:hypothetical protein